MKYKLQTRSNGWVIIQSPDHCEQWRLADKTGLYKQKGSAGSRLRQLRHQDQGTPSSLGARIMASPKFCEVGM